MTERNSEQFVSFAISVEIEWVSWAKIDYVADDVIRCERTDQNDHLIIISVV